MSTLPVTRQLSLLGAVEKTCTRCSRVLPLEDFYRRTEDDNRRFSRCKRCVQEVASLRYFASRPAPQPSPPPLTEKPCTRCRLVLPIESFTRLVKYPKRFQSHCRACKNAASRLYKESHRQQLSDTGKQYYRANAQVVGERIRRSIRANPEKYRAIHADWKRRNKDAVNASTHKRRARLQHNGGSWTAADWERLKARYDWRCLMCGKQEVTDGIRLCFDHVVPLSLGGFNIIANAQPLCRSCNASKHRKVLDFRP